MMKLLRLLEKDESGAVTVDWVVLTAAIVGLGLAVIGVVRLSSEDLADRIAAAINSIEPGGAGCPNPHPGPSGMHCN